jgi:hypothetical protein
MRASAAVMTTVTYGIREEMMRVRSIVVGFEIIERDFTGIKSSAFIAWNSAGWSLS